MLIFHEFIKAKTFYAVKWKERGDIYHFSENQPTSLWNDVTVSLSFPIYKTQNYDIDLMRWWEGGWVPGEICNFTRRQTRNLPGRSLKQLPDSPSEPG